MSRFTIFVGGVHGSGKGNVCRYLSQEIISDYVSASQLLHWAVKDKTVENIEANQKLLTVLLPHALQADKTFVIDGHFALWNKDKTIEEVSQNLFEACDPNVIIVVIENPEIIVVRLKERDGIDYSQEEIERLQAVELENAHRISDNLGIPLYIVQSTKREKVISCVLKIKQHMAIYTRDNISSKMLKTVIFRFDYAGGTDLTRFVNEIKQLDAIKGVFNSLRRIDAPRYNITVNTRDIEAGRLPLAEKQESAIFRFYDCKYDTGVNVILDVSATSVCLTIDCRENYHGSKRYTELMGQLIHSLKTMDSFVSVQRIGIRKIDAQEIGESECISDYFNENYVAAQSWYRSPKQQINYAEFFQIGRVNFNVVQHISSSKNGNPQAILDVDAFIENGDINSLIDDPKSLADFMNYEMQDKMFEMFVYYASKSYLEKCKNL